MNFSAWSVRNPIAPLLAFVLLMVLGWQSFNALPITRFPNIDVPLVAVTVAQAGAAPAELETQITKEIEDAVAGITGVKNILSTVSDGVSTTSVEFRMEVPTDKAVQDTKDAIDQILGDLPGDVDAPIVTRIDVEGQAIMTFAVASPGLTIEELSWFVDDRVKRTLQGQVGVGRIDRYGGADREIRLELDPARLNSLGITAATVSQQLRATNADLGAGRSELGGGEQAIRLLGDAQAAAALADTTIALPSGRFVKVSDLGEVVDTYEELRSFSRFNGEQVVTFAVFRAKGASEVSVAEIVEENLAALRAENPGIQITPVDDTVHYTYGNYESALHTLIEGAILAVLVVLAFLRNWRATLIAAVALPLSAVPTFWVMDLLGFSLNLVSFLAITLATGILVDDAIVEIENIARHIQMGKTPYRASIDAADEIGLAVIATTLTIVAVFVPVSFMPGIPGQYFSQFGMTVAISVLFSLLVARLITPMMAAYLMRPSDAHHGDDREGAIMRGYTAVVKATMRMRYLTLLAALGVLAVSIFFMLRIPGSFLPPEDVSRISISVELPPGSSLEDTDRSTEAMRAVIAEVEGVRDVFVLGGSSPTGEMDIRRAAVSVLLDRLDHSLLNRLAEIGHDIPGLGRMIPPVQSDGRTRVQAEIETEIFAKLAAIPDLRTYKLNDRGERDLTFSVLAQNEADLNIAVARLETALRGDPLLANVAATGALPRPEVQIRPRSDEAARLGISTAAIAETVRVATIGDYDAALAKVAVDDRLIPVRVQLTDRIKDDLASIGALRVPTAAGGSVPLNAVADITVSQGPSAINRLNRERRATIGANLPEGVALDTASARFREIAAGVELPVGARIAESGDAEVQQELVASFGNAMILGLMLVLTVLILLFKSVIQPFTILFSLPLAIGGVAAALIVTGSPVSMPVLIGILMLMGIVTKNAILLVDFAIEMRAQGMNRFDAMVEAGRKRAQPIVMTSIAMSAGMLPSALGVGEGGSFRAPMATAVIGGIIVSTVLSLVIVPSFFLIMDDISWLLGRLFGGLVGKKEEEPEAPDPARTDADLKALASRLDKLETGGAPAKGGDLRHAAE
ncbi:MMPL family transporter [Frigidibacter albus]|uniref:MMPL family transporter n=1 Tax=Frigidibacter albus TaxID=1465486 RepID=A0A6L8VL78_9RHOB|nr:efflux RND transporter permease subunit [Frigidibacter albus]MZQ90814.1 MMPL family transporter [Frigidibacter albus]NBE32568.1 MMPL family transporter [Frigidibacter albus]GGH61277.1 ABC transporter permease [Frigidibacter albus]